MDGNENKVQKLFEFCASGDRVGLADYIISSGCNPSAYDSRDSLCKTALHIACKHGHIDTVRALVEIFDCKLTMKDSNGSLPVHEACLYGHLEIVNYFFSLLPSTDDSDEMFEKKFTVDSPDVMVERVFTSDSDGNNLLHKACQSGSVAVVRYLQQIILDSKPFASNKLNLYLDSVASYRSILTSHFKSSTRHLPITLIQCILSVNCHGDTPLHVACRHGHLEVLKVFGAFLPFFPQLKSLTLVASQCNYYNIVSYLLHQNQRDKDYLDFHSESGKYTPDEKETERHKYPYVRSFDDDELYDTVYVASMQHYRYDHTGENILMCVTCKRRRFIRGLPHTGVRCVKCETSNWQLVTGTYKQFNTDTSSFKILSHFSDSPMHGAAKSGNVKLFDCLLASMSKSHTTLLALTSSPNTSLLHSACISDNVPLLSEIISKFKLNCNIADSEGNTPLHIACRWGSFKVASFLTSLEEIQVNSQNLQLNTPLHFACFYNRLDICKLLILKSSKSGNRTDESAKQTTLHLACCYDNIELVGAIVEYYDSAELINKSDVYGDSPIFNACRCGSLQIVELLVKKGSNPFFLNKQTKETPVHIACRMGRLDLLSVLLQGHADEPNYMNVFDASPLHLAVENNFVEMILFLIKWDHRLVNEKLNASKLTLAHFACYRGHIDIIKDMVQIPVNWDSQNEDGNTALHVACLKNDIEAIELLVNHCSITIQNGKLKTPVHIACESKNSDLTKCLLTGYSKSLDSCTDSKGNTALHTACRNQFIDLEAVSFLAEHCSATSQNKEKQTPLHLACRIDRADILQKLVLTCPESLDDYVDQNQDTVLHYAVTSRSLKCVEILLPYCSPTSQNSMGETAIHIACVNGDLEIVRILTTKCSIVVQTKKGNTYLHSACTDVNSLPLVKFLLEESGLQPKELLTQNSEGNTPLHIACLAGNFDTISYLVDFPEFDPHVCNKWDCFPLYCALSSGHFETVKKTVSEKIINPVTQCTKGQPLPHCLLKSSLIAKHFVELTEFLINGNYCDSFVCDSEGNSLLHCVVVHLDRITFDLLLIIWKYLLSLPDMNVNIQNNDGNTPLHLLCNVNKYYHNVSRNPMLVQLLSHKNIKVSLSARNKQQKTPIQLANNYSVIRRLISYGANPEDVYTEFRFILDKFKHQQPLDPAMKIIVLGNSEAGKTTLVNALERMETFKLSSGDVSSVDGPTAGVKTTELSSKDFGRVTFHDFAGQPEYESGNSVFLESCFHSVTGAQPPIFLLLVDCSQHSSLERSAQYWFTFIKNHSPQQLETPPHVIVVGSHSDLIQHTKHDVIKKSIKTAIHSIQTSKFEVFGPLLLDCRKIGSKQLKTVKKNISRSCSSLRTSVTVDCRCHILFAYLSKWFKGKRAIKLSDVQKRIKLETEDSETMNRPRLISYDYESQGEYVQRLPAGYLTPYGYRSHNQTASIVRSYVQTRNEDILLPITKESILELIQMLHSGGHVLLLQTRKDSWIVLDNDSLFAEVNGTLFAPENFKLPKLPTNTGVVTVEMLHSLFKELDIDLVTGYLEYSEFCQKIEDPETLNLIKRGCSETSDWQEEPESTEPGSINDLPDAKSMSTASKAKLSEQYYFFPALVKSDRPPGIWEPPKHCDFPYSFGWYLLCNRSHFLDPRFLHVLLLRLTFNFAIASQPLVQDSLKRMCTIWKNGIKWCTRNGVEVLVEVVEQNTAVLLLLRCLKDHEMEGVKLRSQVIKKILDTKEQFCPNAEVAEYVLPPCPGYPDISSHEGLIHVSEIAQAISSGEPCIIDSNFQPLPLKTLLFFDPYLLIGQKNIEMLLSEENCDKEVETCFLLELSKQLSTFLKQVTHMLEVPQTEVDLHKEKWKDNLTFLLLHIFESWKVRQANSSHHKLRELFDSYSMFNGRNPLMVSKQVPQQDKPYPNYSKQQIQAASLEDDIESEENPDIAPMQKTLFSPAKGAEAWPSVYTDPLDDPSLSKPTIPLMNQILWLPSSTPQMAEADRKPTKFCLIKEIASAWMTIATVLQLNQYTTDVLMTWPGQKMSNQQCMTKVLKWWMENAEYLPKAHIFEISWKGLYKLLCHSDLHETAEQLKRVLSSPINSVRGNLSGSPLHKTHLKRQRSSTPKRKRRVSGSYSSQD